ncbi:MAG: hypothetical protein ACJ8ER_01730 [Allosphingosinicella sp.]
MLGSAGYFSGSQAMRPSLECPPLRKADAKPTPPPVYLTSSEIRLGAPLCLALDRARFFASERAALTEQERVVKAGEAALAAAGTAQPGSPAAVAAQTRLSQAKAALDALPKERKIFLFVDEVKVPMEGRTVAVGGPTGDNDWVIEQIPLRGVEDASSEAGKAWRDILGGPKGGGTRAVRIGVAVGEGDDPPPVLREPVRERATLRVFNPLWVLVGGLGLLLLAAGIVMSGWKTGLLRDGDSDSPFSLGRVQMGWWLVLTLGGFLFIWLVSGQWRGVLTSGVIALLGISATTGVAARMVDTGTGSGAGTGTGTPAAKPAKSVSFWSDIMGDANGAALHRLQLIAWTVVLGAIFAWTIIWRFAFPEFDTNLLLLAGIAGGTYLGFKFQEA